MFGVGGVGLNVVQFAQLAGAYPIVAVDLLDNKLDMAQVARRDPQLNSAKVDDLAAAIREIVGAKGPGQGDRDHRRQIGDRARLRPHPCRRHLRAGRRARTRR